MNLSTKVLLPVAFIITLALIAGGVWFYQMFVGSAGTTTTTRNDSGGFFGSLFPFGSGGDTVTPGTIPEPDEQDTTPIPRLRLMSEAEVAGAAFAIGHNSALVVRYVERETGHIYESPVDSWAATRLTNTTIPAVHDAVWVSASTTLLRLLNDEGVVENFIGSFSSTTPDQSLQGIFLKPYTRVAVVAGGAIIAGITESAGGSALEVVSPGGNNPKSLFGSTIRSWIPLAAGNDVLVATAPAAGEPGALYDATTVSKIIGDIPGMLALPAPSGKRILVTSGSRRAMSTLLYDRDSGQQITVPRGTLAPKCAWVGETRVLCAIPTSLPLANYPTDWLLGRVHTEDELWFINTDTGIMTAAATLSEEAGKALDVYKVSVSPDGRYAAFIDRLTQHLWLLDLQGQ